MKCDAHPLRPALLTRVNNSAGVYKRQCLECRMAEIVQMRPTTSTRAIARSGEKPWEQHDER